MHPDELPTKRHLQHGIVAASENLRVATVDVFAVERDGRREPGVLQ